MTPGRLAAICAARVFLFATFMTVAAVIPLLMQEWRLTAAAAGAIVSSFTVSYALSVFGFAWAADHFGAKRMVMASALAAAASGAAFAFLARDWSSAIGLYALVGLAQGGVYTPLIMVIADEVAPARRGSAMGWLIASTSIGYAGSLGAAAIGVSLGGLKVAFLLSGLLPALGAAMLVAALHPFANRVHRRAPGGGGLADELLKNRESRLLTLGYTGHSWEVVGMWAWIPAFLAAGFALKGAEAAGATVSGAWLAGLLHVFGAAAAFTMGRLSDRAGRRPVLVTLAAAGALVSFTLGWLVYAPSIVLVPLAVAYAFVTLGDSPVLTTAISEAVRPAYLGGVLAWRGLAGFGAGAIAPLAVGMVLDGFVSRGPIVSWGLGFATLGLGGAAALACALLLRQHRPHAVAHRPHDVAGKRVAHEKRKQHE
ncbi:MAG TPA: MFS transporter [Burkholderiales bacterium]|nr:MFS transporter [Burkholderiales bacterium]